VLLETVEAREEVVGRDASQAEDGVDLSLDPVTASLVVVLRPEVDERRPADELVVVEAVEGRQRSAGVGQKPVVVADEDDPLSAAAVERALPVLAHGEDAVARAVADAFVADPLHEAPRGEVIAVVLHDDLDLRTRLPEQGRERVLQGVGPPKCGDDEREKRHGPRSPALRRC
jgi:hypothetical protein